MLLTRFLSYFARVAPGKPAKIRFVLHHNGKAVQLATVRNVEFEIDAATWSVNLDLGLKVEAAAKGNGNAETTSQQ